MAELNPLPADKSKSAGAVRWFIARSEQIACILLCLWCLLPVFMSGYDLIMGALGCFPTQDQFGESLQLGRIVYNVALNTYYKAFCALGLVTLLFAALSLALCWPRVWEKGSVRKRPWFYLLALLLLWAVVSAILAEDPVFAVLGGNYMHVGLVSYFIFAGLFLCASMISSAQYRRFLLWIFCAVLSWLSALMLLQETGIPFLDYCFPARHAVVFSNSNHFAYLLCMGISASAGLFLFDREKGMLRRILSLAVFCLQTVTLLYNGTFGADLGALFGLIAAYLFYFKRGEKTEWHAFLPLALFILLSVLNTVGILSSGYSLATDFGRLQSYLEKLAEGVPIGDNAGSGRMLLWKQTLKRIAARPIFGFGPEGFYGEYALNKKNSATHNEYLQMAGYLGIPALCLYLAALLTLAVRQWKQLKNLEPLLLAVSGATVGYLFSALFGNPLFNTAPYYWIFLGMTTFGTEAPLLSLKEAKAEERLLERTKKKGIVGRLVPVVLIVALILGGVGVYLRHNAETAYETADLQCMIVAESAAAFLYRGGAPEEPESYWFDAGSFSLIPASEAMPSPCGMGTRRRGDALAPFCAEYGRDYEYKEKEDYTNRLVAVTVSSGADGSLQTDLTWVEYAP